MMSAARTTEDRTKLQDAALDAMVAEDPNEPGRHYARLVDSGHHVWVILASLQRSQGDIAEAMADWHVSEEEVRAAIRYYERHRAVFDAFFLLQREQDEALDRLLDSR